MNMLGLNNLSGMCGMNGGFNPVSQLFSGTNSVFNHNNFFGSMVNVFGSGSCSPFMNCNGTYNYGAMAGFGVANALLGVGGMFLNQVLSKKENSQTSIKEDISGMNKQIDAKVDELGAKSIEEALAWSTKKEPKWQKAITEAEDEKTTAQGNLNEAQAIIDKYKDKDVTKLTDPEKKEYDKAIADKSKLEAKLAAGEYDKAIENAKAAEEKRQNEIDAIKEKLQDLLDAKENAENQIKEQQEEQILDKADGNRFQRSSLEDINKLFDENGNIRAFIENKKSKTTKADGDKSQETSLEKVKVTRADVRYAILAYRKSTDDDEKKEWADKFAKLLDKLPYEDRSNDILAAEKIILG